MSEYCKNCFELAEKLAKREQECEELKKELDLYKTWYRAKHGDIKNLLGSYHKALEEIEEECNYAPMCDTEFSQRVLDLINKAKGEK